MNKKKLRYAILKELEKGNENISEETFCVEGNEFYEQVRFLDREKYITTPMYGDDIVHVMSFVLLTEKGENYLEENSNLAKAYSIAKELRDWIK